MKKLRFSVDKKIRLDEFLKQKNISQRMFLKLYKNQITINGILAKRNSKVEPKDEVVVYLEDEANNYNPVKMDIKVLFEDQNIIILDKPANLTMNSEGEINLANYVSYLFKERNINQKVRFINRLDMDTSGIVMIAKDSISQTFYQNQMIDKRYLAVVRGYSEDKEIILNIKRDSIKSKISEDGKKSITLLKNLKKYNGYSLVELKLKTGRTHQIRVTMAHNETPIVGDSLYNNKEKFSQLLHAYKIIFFDVKNQKHEIITNVPERFKNFLDKL